MFVSYLLWMMTFGSEGARAEAGPRIAIERSLICQGALGADRLAELISDLKTVEAFLPGLLGAEVETRDWFRMLRRYVDPMRSPLLTAAVTGSGSSRKSTIFSAIESLMSGDPEVGLRDRWSPSTFAAGATKQPVWLVGKPAPGEDPGRLAARNAQLETRSKGLTSPNRAWAPGRALESGEGVLAETDRLAPHFAILDTPGYDLNQPDLEAAVAAVGSADVVILAVSGGTMGNLLNRQIMKRIFESHGVRRMVVVVTEVSASPASRDHVFAEIHKLAWDIYDEDEPTIAESREGRLPKNLMGVYIMPTSERVEAQVEHPTFHPIRKNATELYPAFADLLKRMSAERNEIKSYALQKASRTILTEASRAVDARIRAALAAEVYLAVLAEARAEAVKRGEFNYDIAKSLKALRASLNKYEGRSGRLEQIADLIQLGPIDAFEKKVRELSRRLARLIGPQTQTGPNGERILDVGVTKSMHAFNRPLVALAERGTASIRADGGRAAELARRYDALFGSAPVDRVSNDARDEPSRVALPPLAVLDPQVKEAIDRLVIKQSESGERMQAVLEESLRKALDPSENEVGVFLPRDGLRTALERGFKWSILPLSFAVNFATGTFFLHPVQSAFWNYATAASSNKVLSYLEGFFLEQGATKKINDHVAGRMGCYLADLSLQLTSSLHAQARLGPGAAEVQRILAKWLPDAPIIPVHLEGDAPVEPDSPARKGIAAD